MSELDGVQLHRVDSVDDAMEFKRWLGERRPILAVDTETTGLNVLEDRVRLVQFGDAYQGWTIRASRWLGLIEEVFREYEDDYVFHNAVYDWAITKHSLGIELPQHRIHDTMIMAHALDSTRSIALKSLSTMHIDGKAGVAQKMLNKAFDDNGWDWSTIPYEVPVYSVYAGMDTVLTARMYNLLMPEVQQVCSRAYDLELAFAWAVMRMRLRGTRIDRPYTEEALDSFTAYVKQATKWAADHYGVKAGNNEEVIERLKQDGITFTKFTCGCVQGETCHAANCGENLALDKEVLQGIIATTNHPLASTILQRRRTQKLASTYLKNFLKFADGDDLMRPDMMSLGARTGRMSIRDPALQTLPRRSDENTLAITVRNCIVPRDDNVLLMCDFDQIEMRMFAHLANDDGMRQAFAEGDFFTNIARELYGDPNLVKKDPRRQLTKNGMYALGYGAGAAKIAVTTGVPLHDVQNFITLLGQRFPGIKRLQHDVAQTALERKATEGRAYVRSPLTGRRHYADDGKEYALVNYLIQGTAAEVLKIKTLELDNAGLLDYLILLVHDEVILDAPRKEVPEIVGTLNKVMNDDQIFSVPLTAGTDAGFRWGEKGAVSIEEATTYDDE